MKLVTSAGQRRRAAPCRRSVRTTLTISSFAAGQGLDVAPRRRCGGTTRSSSPQTTRAGAFDRAEQVRQGLAVHVGLPGDAEAHLAADVPHLELVDARLGAVQPVERRLIVETRAHIVDVAGDRLVEDVALRRLDAHGADQHQVREIAGRHGRHLGRDPAAEAQPDQRRPRAAELVQQAAIDDGDVARAAHPVGARRAAVAGMMRHQHVVVRRQGVVEGQVVERAGLVVQHQQRMAAAATLHVQRGAADLDGGARPVHCRHWRLPPRLVVGWMVATSNRRVKLVRRLASRRAVRRRTLRSCPLSSCLPAPRAGARSPRGRASAARPCRAA